MCRRLHRSVSTHWLLAGLETSGRFTGTWAQVLGRLHSQWPGSQQQLVPSVSSQQQLQLQQQNALLQHQLAMAQQRGGVDVSRFQAHSAQTQVSSQRRMCFW